MLEDQEEKPVRAREAKLMIMSDRLLQSQLEGCNKKCSEARKELMAEKEGLAVITDVRRRGIEETFEYFEALVHETNARKPAPQE